jgi:hypothetical protein
MPMKSDAWERFLQPSKAARTLRPSPAASLRTSAERLHMQTFRHTMEGGPQRSRVLGGGSWLPRASGGGRARGRRRWLGEEDDARPSPSPLSRRARGPHHQLESRPATTVGIPEVLCSLLTQNMHSAPITQQAEKLSFARAERK